MTEINLTCAIVTTWVLGFAIPFVFPSLFGFDKKIDRKASNQRPWLK